MATTETQLSCAKVGMRLPDAAECIVFYTVGSPDIGPFVGSISSPSVPRLNASAASADATKLSHPRLFLILFLHASACRGLWWRLRCGGLSNRRELRSKLKALGVDPDALDGSAQLTHDTPSSVSKANEESYDRLAACRRSAASNQQAWHPALS